MMYVNVFMSVNSACRRYKCCKYSLQALYCGFGQRTPNTISCKIPYQALQISGRCTVYICSAFTCQFTNEISTNLWLLSFPQDLHMEHSTILNIATTIKLDSKENDSKKTTMTQNREKYKKSYKI